MGKSKPKMEVTEYYMSVHYGICTGPPDALLGLIVKEKSAWSGAQTEPGAFALNNPNFFGGVKKEGGLAGSVTYLPGRSDQVLPDALAARLGRGTGANCPGYRGLASLFFTGSGSYPGFYWTANSPYLPGVWASVRRIFKRSDGSDQWYPAKAEVPSLGGSTGGTEVLLMADTAIPANNSSPDGLSGGITFDLGPGESLRIKKIAGMTYQSWSYTPVDGYAGFPGDWRSDFSLRDAEGNITDYWLPSPSFWEVRADAIAYALAQPPVTVSGSSSFTIFPRDATVNDNREGLSVQVYKVLADSGDMNPAHIIHECLTDTTWGMGAPLSALDDASFTAAADALYDEGLGLSLMWTRQAAIEDFVTEILDHIQAVLFVDPATGLLTLKLIRDDYDPDTLPVLTPDNADVTKFDRKLWGEIINEIIVTWTNPENEQEETVTSQDLASIAMQGGNVVSASRNYYGVRNANLATQLGRRDLRTVGAPLCSAEVEIDRSAYALRPASVVKLTWPEHGLDEIIMRVMSIDYGRPGDMTIRVTLMEDVFSLDAGAYVEPTGSEWNDPSSAPVPITEARVITLPPFMAAEAVAQNGGSEPVYPEVVAGILATTADTDTFAYSLQSELSLPDGSLQWTALADNNIIGRGAIAADLVAEAASTAVTVTGFSGQTIPTQSGFALIGDSTDDETVMEVAMVTAFDSSTGEFSLARGVMDTVPRAWAAGTQIWFVDGETLFEDRQVRSAGETVEYKLLSQTSQGQLPLASAPLLTGTMTERPWLPLRPANVTAYGDAWSSETTLIDATERPDPWVTVAWSNRNRLTEDSQILLWTDATVTPEDAQTTTIEVRDLDDTLMATHDGLTGTSFDVPDASFGGESFVKLRVYSERDGFESLQFFDHWVQVAPLTFDSTRITFDSDTPTMDQN